MDGIIDNPATIFLVAGLVLLGIIFIVGVSPLMFVAAGAFVISGVLYIAGWNGGVLYLTAGIPVGHDRPRVG